MRPRRPAYLPSHYYHIYNRGANREPIFQDEDNYLFILSKIKRYCHELSLALIAYCLMPNHYHWLVRQDGEDAAGLLAQRVFNSYTKAYNNRYDRSGTLFEGPYKVIQLDADAHLLHLCRYIHANPVAHGLVAAVAEWAYSNYPEWVELREGTLVDRAFVREHFTVAGYEAFVHSYLHDRQLPQKVAEYLATWEAD
jgi:REP element-mobilizing transposase RayT